jgi:hypothetical protein
MIENTRGLKASVLTIVVLILWVCATPSFTADSFLNAQASSKGKKIYAQKLVEELAARHSEVTGIEVSATPPEGQHCVTIAATEAKDLGEKCDEDEFAALRTGKPLVDKEEDGFDITLPIHDATGKIIGTMGLDFKPQPGQKESEVVERAKQIASQFEEQVPARARLFESTK